MISDGKLNYKSLLEEFWIDFKSHLDKMSNLERTEILKTLENELEELFFSSETEENKTSRICPKSSNGELGLQLGKYGAFIWCSNYPESKYTKQIAKNEKNEVDFDTSIFDENGKPDVAKIDPLARLGGRKYASLNEAWDIIRPS